MRNQRPVSGSSVAGGGGGGDRSCPLASASRGDGVPTLGGEKSATRGGRHYAETRGGGSERSQRTVIIYLELDRQIYRYTDNIVVRLKEFNIYSYQ